MISGITYDPDIIAYSMNFSTQHDFFTRCEKPIKDKWPNSVSVAGGTHTTNITRELFRQSSIDYIVRGEAEESFPQMLEYISKDEAAKAKTVQGVYSKESIADVKTLEISKYPDLKGHVDRF